MPVSKLPIQSLTMATEPPSFPLTIVTAVILIFAVAVTAMVMITSSNGKK